MKKQQKFLFIFFLILFCGFLNLAPFFAFSAELEVDYPTLASGQDLGPQSTLPEYMKYMFDLGMFVGFFAVFLGLAWGGVMFFLAGASPQAKADAKDRVVGAITGLIILITLYLIATTINPQLRFFQLEPLQPIPPPLEQPQPGVFFNKSDNCSDQNSPANTSSIPDLGSDLRNRVNSVKFVKSQTGDIAYISIIYDTINYKGKCQYLDPNETCQRVESFANSASIYQYDFKPDGDGVFFFRKSFYGYNPEDSNIRGGAFKIDNNQIKGIFKEKLENLFFEDVPEEEQDCAIYSQIPGTQTQLCVQRKPPSLAGENISSIYIKGNYIVLLLYFSPTDDPKGPWTYCQMYPGIEDTNKNGPVQIKWDAIRNNRNSVIPNWVLIIPVNQK